MGQTNKSNTKEEIADIIKEIVSYATWVGYDLEKKEK